MNVSFLPSIVMLITLMTCTVAQTALADNDSDLGIAAQFPNDRNIQSHPAVIFATGFEGDNKLVGWTKLRASETISTTSNPEIVFAGNNSAQITATRGKDVGGALIYRWEKGVDRLYFRFYCRFHEETCHPHHFVNIGANCPGRETEGHAGSRPKGHEGFSTTIEPPSPDRDWVLYTYWQEMHSWQNEDGSPNNPPDGDGRSFYGNTFVPDNQPTGLPRDHWICIEIMMKSNTIGKSDGEQALWIDGKKMGHWKPGEPIGTWMRATFHTSGYWNTDPKPFEGYDWRSDPELKLNHIILQWYISKEHGLKSKVDENIVYFDDVVLATEYIGPQVKTASAKPETPRAD